ncbi:hypothetical protein DSUL_200001 [Desulfovibrionales bacterium]
MKYLISAMKRPILQYKSVRQVALDLSNLAGLYFLGLGRIFSDFAHFSTLAGLVFFVSLNSRVCIAIVVTRSTHSYYIVPVNKDSIKNHGRSV